MLEEVMAKDGYPLTLEGRSNFGSVYYEAVRKEYACKHPDKDFVRELSKSYHATKKDFEENNFCWLSGLIRERRLDEEHIAEECEQEGYDYENTVSYFCIPYYLTGNFFHIIGVSECDFNGVSVLHIAHGLKKDNDRSRMLCAWLVEVRDKELLHIINYPLHLRSKLYGNKEAGTFFHPYKERKIIAVNLPCPAWLEAQIRAVVLSPDYDCEWDKATEG